MYLNLDLIYNVNNYLYPLFYYKIKHREFLVYSPMTKKSVYKNACGIIYHDFITKKYNEYKGVSLVCTFDDTGYIFTENTLNFNDFIFNKCKSFRVRKEDLYFLKSNTRIIKY